jgi:hypothetical protein
MTEVLRSEWTKIRSVRSTMWTLVTGAVLMLGIGVLATAATAGAGDRAVPQDPTFLSLSGMPLAAMAMAALGVLVISGEYRTGMIRTTLLAVPRRTRMLAAKAVVFAAVAFAVTAIATFVSFFVGQALLGEKAAALGDPGVLRAVIGCPLFLTACGLFGLALGTLIRHTAGAIVAALGMIFLLPQMTNLLPGTWGDRVHDYFTTNAGQQVAFVHTEDGLGPWTGFAVYCAWIALTMLTASALLIRRDA